MTWDPSHWVQTLLHLLPPQTKLLKQCFFCFLSSLTLSRVLTKLIRFETHISALSLRNLWAEVSLKRLISLKQKICCFSSYTFWYNIFFDKRWSFKDPVSTQILSFSPAQLSLSTFFQQDVFYENEKNSPDAHFWGDNCELALAPLWATPTRVVVGAVAAWRKLASPVNHGEVVLKSGKKKFGGKVVTFTFHLFSFDSIPPVKKKLEHVWVAGGAQGWGSWGRLWCGTVGVGGGNYNPRFVIPTF